MHPHLVDGIPACSPNLVANFNQFVAFLSDRTFIPCSGVEQIWLQKIFVGILVVDPHFFLPPTRRGLREHPYRALQCCQKGGSAVSASVVKHWNKLPAPFITADSVNIFKKSFDKVRTEIFWLNTHRPNFLTPPPLHLHSTTSICYPTPYSVCGFFRPAIAYF